MTAQADYDRYHDLRTDLAQVVADLAQVAWALGLAARATHLAGVEARLRDSRFRLMVLGEFKRGKSTLVNALLGAPVLPMRVAPCTGMITVVRHGDPASARLLPADPHADPIPVALDAIRDHITISLDDDGTDPEGMDASSPSDPSATSGPVAMARIELRHPLPLLENGVELVDSPGLNEHAVRTALALEDLPRADAVVLVLSCEQQLGHTERAFVERQLIPGPDGSLANVFFVWNRFDAISDDPDEVAALADLTAEVLLPRLGGRARVFRLSARDALLGRVRGEPDRVQRSGMPELEAALARFLTVERGHAKLLGPLQSASGAVAELQGRVLPERAAMLRAPVDALVQQLDELGPRLAGVHARRKALHAALQARRTALSRRLRVLLGMFGERVREALPETIDRVQVQWSGAAWNRAAVVDGLGEFLQDWLETEAGRFEAQEVRPALEREAQELDALLEDRLADILSELDALRTELLPRVAESGTAHGPSLSATERVLSALGGFVMGGPGGAVEGATFGWRNVVGGLPVYLSVGLALALGGVSLPVALSVVTGVGVLRTWLTGKDAAERLREQVQAGFREAFDAELAEMARRVEAEVAARYQRLIEAVDGATEAVISELEEELADVRTRHAAGAEALAEGLAALDQQQTVLADIDRRLQRIRADLVP